MQKEGFSVSYNTRTNNPNWVSWVITKKNLMGSLKRRDCFRADPQLPIVNQIEGSKDYKTEGFSRGRMCPHGDMNWNRKAQMDSFLMSNICPMYQGLNAGVWYKLEELCRSWASYYDSVFVVAGPTFLHGDSLTMGNDDRIRISIPDGFFKVILIKNGLKHKAIGFHFKNVEYSQKIIPNAKTVDEIEKMTGFDFFSSLPDNIEKKIESNMLISEWGLDSIEYYYHDLFLSQNINHEKEFVFINKEDGYFHYNSYCNAIRDRNDYEWIELNDSIRTIKFQCLYCFKNITSNAYKKKQEPENELEYVYIVKGKHSKEYHSRANCPNIKNLKTISAISIKDAEKMPLTPCPACYSAINENNKKENPDIVTVNRKYWNVFLFLFWALITFVCTIITFVIMFKYLKKRKRKRSKSTNTLSYKPEIADTDTISKFLQQFGKKDALKYTTHIWDEKRLYKDFSDFKSQYNLILLKWKERISERCPHLWKLISNFLLSEDGGSPWSEYEIKVGYNKYVEKWMDENPDKQPFDMPLNAFPNEIRITIINENSIDKFQDIIAEFKKCIEFREDDLRLFIEKLFYTHNINYKEESLDCLDGKTFYTDTERIKEAIKIITNNLSQHGKDSCIKVFCKEEKNDEKRIIRLEFLQEGSFSNRDIKDHKITAEDKDGDLATIKDKLRHLCDFAVESKFRVNDKPTPLHINYLVSDESQKGMCEISEDECLGFKYILTFYSYYK